MQRNVDRLSREEMRQLHEYIEKKEQESAGGTNAMDVEALLKGLEAIRAGLGDEESDEIERAMNEEFTELFDESEWRA